MIRANHRPDERNRSKAVPLASLSIPQRTLISALLEAAKAAAIRPGAASSAETTAPAAGMPRHRRELRP